jgi:hypothetical protein
MTAGRGEFRGRESVMNQQEIASALMDAIGAIGSIVGEDNIKLAIMVNRDSKSHPTIGRLIDTLRAEPSLKIFDGMMQVIANSDLRGVGPREVFDMAGRTVKSVI